MTQANIRPLDGRTRASWIRLRTMILLRWFAIAGQLTAVTVAQWALGLQLAFGLCYLTIGASVVGNLVDDPELRFPPSGAAVANFRIASTPRNFNRQTNEWEDGEALFLSCSIWRQAAENVAESLQKGMRVVVQGRLKSRSYETREGEKRTVMELDVEEVGPSLKYATAKVTRTTRQGGGGGFNGGGGGGGGYSGGGQAPAQGNDPWATAGPQGGGRPQGGGGGQGGQDPWGAPGVSDEPPF